MKQVQDTPTPFSPEVQPGGYLQPVEPASEEIIPDEWTSLTPSMKKMGLVRFTLDKGVKTTVVGTVYGLDFEIEGAGYRMEVFFDYYNKRLKVNDYEATDYTSMIRRLAYLAENNDFDKIFLKAAKDDFQIFLSHGYMMEGVLRYYFRGEDAFVLSRFSSSSRVSSSSLIQEAELIEELVYRSNRGVLTPLDPDIRIITAQPEHIPALVRIYRSVFETYPSPLTNPDYIESTMELDIIYKLAYRGDEALAAASADVDVKHSNAEMTDCASSPGLQGKGLMQHLLLSLEKDIQAKGIMTAYTLARGMSYGMNRVFFKLGYEFSGRLVNNCDIFGHFEDMNIWVKQLAPAA